MRPKDIETIQLRDINFRYGDREIFQSFSVDLTAGSKIWLVGQPGQGKSSMLKMLGGLLMPNKGSYQINGEEITRMSFEEFLPYRLNLGYGFDLGGLLSNKTLFENLMLPLLYHGFLDVEAAEARVADLFKRFHLEEIQGLRPFSATGSQRKLICLLRSLVHKPQVVLLDDPTTGLKEEALKTFYQLVEELIAEGSLRKIIYCSDDPRVLQQWRPREVILHPPGPSVTVVAA